MVKALSLNEIRNRAAKFSLEWADSPGDERQDAQSFLRDLLGVYGITKTRAAFYEKRSRRTSTGAQGYIDAVIPGIALIEMKSAGKDLLDAERQALDYIDSLSEPEMPSYVITSNFHQFRVLDLARHVDEHVEVVELGLQLGDALELALPVPQSTRDLLRVRGVVPQIRRTRLLVERIDVGLEPLDVDNGTDVGEV